MVLRPYTKEWLIELCKTSYSYAEVLRKAGRKVAGGNQATLKKKIKEWDIDISHFTGQLWNKGLTYGEHESIRGRSNEEIFCKNSTAYRQAARKRILNQNLLEYKCAICGNNGEWQG